MISLERVLKLYIDDYIGECYFSLPAVVVGVQNLHQNRIDVIPLPNKNHDDNTIQEYPVVRNVLVATQGTKDCAILFPIKQGDVVMLTFAQSAIDQLKEGATSPYDNFNRRFLDINDAVAYAGLTPFTESNRDPLRHTFEHSLDDVVVVNNIGTTKQNELRLHNDGEITINTNSVVNVNSKSKFKKQIKADGSIECESIKPLNATSGMFFSLDGKTIIVKDGSVISIT